MKSKKDVLLAFLVVGSLYFFTYVILSILEEHTLSLILIEILSGVVITLIFNKWISNISIHLRVLLILFIILFILGCIGFYKIASSNMNYLWKYFPDFLTTSFMFLSIMIYTLFLFIIKKFK